MKKVAGTLRLDLAQFRDLEAFAQFGSELDKASQQQLDRGRRLVELLKQPQYVPMSVERQILMIYAGTKGYLDNLPAENVQQFEKELYDYAERQENSVLPQIAEKKALDDELEAAVKSTLETFKARFVEHHEITLETAA